MTKPAKAFLILQYGGAGVLSLQDISVPAPAAGEVQIDQRAIGVNYIDIYHRKGVFAPKQPLPRPLGLEGIGAVTAVGADVAGFVVGDRIAYAGGPLGGYATLRNVAVARALKMPSGLGSEAVAAMLFKGLTAEYLVHRCVAIASGETVLFHAAAGGVGSIAYQWLTAKGVRVIGTVSTQEKAKIAGDNGCDEVIIYTEEDFPARVAEITEDKGVCVVFDSVGADTFEKSLTCLRPRGKMVSFGESSGPIPPLNVASLGALGSLFVTRPSIAHYTAERNEFVAAAQRLFAAMGDGTLRPPRVTRYAFEDAALAHADMEARRTSGSIVLVP